MVVRVKRWKSLPVRLIVSYLFKQHVHIGHSLCFLLFVFQHPCFIRFIVCNLLFGNIRHLIINFWVTDLSPPEFLIMAMYKPFPRSEM